MNLGQLQTRVKRLLGRDDADQAPLADYINTAADRLSRSIKIPSLETAVTVTVTGGYFVLPGDTAFLRYVYPAPGKGDELKVVSSPEFRSLQQNLGDPVAYFQVGQNIYVAPVPLDGTQLGMVYWRFDTALVQPSDHNGISGFASDALIYGALYEAAIDFDDMERAGLFEQEFQKRKAEVEQQAADFYSSLAPQAQRSYLADAFDC